MINRYFNEKIEGYKNQDSIAGRKIDKNNYVDLSFVYDRFDFSYGIGHCDSCRKPYYLVLKM